MMKLDAYHAAFVDAALVAASAGPAAFDAFLDDPAWDAIWWQTFSLGGCQPAMSAPDACFWPRRESAYSSGLEWGESDWGDKRQRRNSIVRQYDESPITPEEREKLVAYRRRLVETTGRAIVVDIVDTDTMLTIQENWQELLDKC